MVERFRKWGTSVVDHARSGLSLLYHVLRLRSNSGSMSRTTEELAVMELHPAVKAQQMTLRQCNHG